jgi:glutathione S-transferase
MRYLASRYDGASLYPQALDQRSDVDRWLDWQLSTLAPAIFPVFWGLIWTSPAERDNEAIAAATAYLTEVWRMLDHELSRRNMPLATNLHWPISRSEVRSTACSRFQLSGQISCI